MNTLETLTLSPEEQELLAAEVQALLPHLPAERRAAYQDLARAVARGEIPPAQVGLLEQVLALTLTSGRARQRHRAEGERILTDLFQRTPRGQALLQHLEEVNRALRALAGRPLHSVRVGLRTLGHLTLTLEVEGATLTLAVRPDSVQVESLAVG